MSNGAIKKGTRGYIKADGGLFAATIIHDSPENQETIEVVVIDDWRCVECGELIEIQRNQFVEE